jgi:hypothetical protein
MLSIARLFSALIFHRRIIAALWGPLEARRVSRICHAVEEVR